MLKLTQRQIYQASQLAARIEMLEETKDRLKGWTVPFELDRRGYEVIEIEVPTEAARAALAVKIAQAHADLAAMGLEIVPGS